MIGFFAPDTNGALITAYTIKIAGLDDQFYESQECYDTLTPGTHDYFSCTVSFTTLRAAPFNLIYGSLVAVIVQATNNIGSGEFSQPNVMGSTV